MEDAASNPPAATKARKTRGRQRIEIKKIDVKSRRQVTFSKRKKGLFKKAQGISTLCGAEIAVFALTEPGNGNVKVYKNDNADAVLDRFLAESPHDVIDEEIGVSEEEIGEEEANNAGGFLLDQPTLEKLSITELVEYGMALEDLRDCAASRLEELSLLNSIRVSRVLPSSRNSL